MITCRELIEFLSDYVDGDLTPETVRAFDEHLRVCPDCVNYVDSFRTTIRLGQAAFASDQCEGANDQPADAPEGLIRAIVSARTRV